MGSKSGRGSRARAHAKRMAQKRARKTTQQALYASWRDAGTHKKSRRFLKRSAGSNRVASARVPAMIPVLIAGNLVLALRKVHGGVKCHNVGCRKCSEVWQERAGRLR